MNKTKIIRIYSVDNQVVRVECKDVLHVPVDTPVADVRIAIAAMAENAVGW